MGRCSKNEVFHMEGVDEEEMLPDDKKNSCCKVVQGIAERRGCKEKMLQREGVAEGKVLQRERAPCTRYCKRNALI